MTTRARPRKRLPGETPGTLFKTRPYEIPGLAGARPCTIWFPPAYFRDPQARFPVAYMFDGQNLFGDEGSFSGGWHVHRVMDARAAKGKVVPIVVGIHHGGATRAEELSPWGIGRGKHGKADALLDWVTGTLRRFVAEDLRVLEGPEHTLVGGSSLGGLAALYAGFRHPDVFGRVLAMSPSLWVHRGGIHAIARQARLAPGARFYLDAGGREMGGRMLHDAERLAWLLAERGLVPSQDLMWRPDQRGSHNERAWSRRLPKAVRFLYDGRVR
jgi:predicted alpha/beta superfamily hydrolase